MGIAPCFHCATSRVANSRASGLRDPRALHFFFSLTCSLASSLAGKMTLLSLLLLLPIDQAWARKKSQPARQARHLARGKTAAGSSVMPRALGGRAARKSTVAMPSGLGSRPGAERASAISSPRREKKWEGSQPPVMADGEKMQKLLAALLDQRLDAGVAALAARMILFFTDAPSKEAAFRGLVAILDRGYPRSLTQLFSYGDLSPARDDSGFSNSYYLYQGIFFSQSLSPQWAQASFEQVDHGVQVGQGLSGAGVSGLGVGGGFAKYLFYQSLVVYANHDLPQTEQLLLQVLSQEKGLPERASFVKKVARNLARVYFEQAKYEQSLDVYQRFLLQWESVTALDWLESAWNLFHLKRYSEALGVLYNLMRFERDHSIDLESYFLRALIYRRVCAGDRAQILIQSFDKQFGTTLKGIQTGVPLESLPQLHKISLPQNGQYVARQQNVAELQAEQAQLVVEAGLREAARFIYQSELRKQKAELQIAQTEALEQAARSVVDLSEELKLLKFDVIREKENPDQVFKAQLNAQDGGKSVAESASASGSVPSALASVGGSGGENGGVSGKDQKLAGTDVQDIELRFEQFGELWADERSHFQVPLVNQCQ